VLVLLLISYNYIVLNRMYMTRQIFRDFSRSIFVYIVRRLSTSLHYDLLLRHPFSSSGNIAQARDLSNADTKIIKLTINGMIQQYHFLFKKKIL